jgi:DsbC/DsbD-like thiol-disulfide interchange protein
MITHAEDAADQHAEVALVSEQQAIVPGQKFLLGVWFHLQDGWHTYWVNPGDAGEPPRITWELPAGFQAGSIQWPYPTRLSTPPFADFGYEHQVLLTVPVQPPSGLGPGGNEKIVARIRYLICRDVCIPGQKQLVLTLPVKNRTEPGSDAPLFKTAQQQVPRPVPNGWRISAKSVGEEFRLRLRTGKFAVLPQFFPLEPEQIENAAPQNVTPTPEGYELRLKKSNHLLQPIARLKGVIVVAGMAYSVDVPVLQPFGRGRVQSKQN